MRLSKKKEKGIAKKGGDAALIIQKFKVMFAWNQNKNYILHILYTNSKLNIDLPYNNTDLPPANKHN